MKPLFFILIAAGLLLAGCGKNSSGSHPQAAAASQTNNTADNANPAAPSGGYLGSLMQADKYAVKTIDLSYLNQAIQLFNTQEGHLPKDLDELVPNYVAKIPEAPYGSKIVYDPGSGTVKVVKQ